MSVLERLRAEEPISENDQNDLAEILKALPLRRALGEVIRRADLRDRVSHVDLSNIGFCHELKGEIFGTLRAIEQLYELVEKYDVDKEP